MENEKYLSVIIPAYNEEKLIEATFLKIDSFCKKQKYKYEIIIVDDGSCDGTLVILEKLKSVSENLIIIKNDYNSGKGYSVARGMLAASGKFRLFMDADNSTNIEQITNFFPFIKNGYDVAIGDRKLKESEIKKYQSLYKKLLGNFGNFLIQIFAVPGISDTQCGFKIFSAESAEDIFSKSTINRWGFDVEILAIANRLGYKIKTVPVVWKNRKESRVKLTDYMRTLNELFQIKINLIIKKYDNKK